MEHPRHLGHHEKTKPTNMGIEEEEIQTKGIDKVFNRIIAENFPALKKERVIQVQEAYRTQNYKDQKRNTEQRKNTESYKREKTSHI
jgi:hypothetical protein